MPLLYLGSDKIDAVERVQRKKGLYFTIILHGLNTNLRMGKFGQKIEVLTIIPYYY